MALKTINNIKRIMYPNMCNQIRNNIVLLKIVSHLSLAYFYTKKNRYCGLYLKDRHIMCYRLYNIVVYFFSLPYTTKYKNNERHRSAAAAEIIKYMKIYSTTKIFNFIRSNKSPRPHISYQ